MNLVQMLMYTLLYIYENIQWQNRLTWQNYCEVRRGHYFLTRWLFPPARPPASLAARPPAGPPGRPPAIPTDRPNDRLSDLIGWIHSLSTAPSSSNTSQKISEPWRLQCNLYIYICIYILVCIDTRWCLFCSLTQNRSPRKKGRCALVVPLPSKFERAEYLQIPSQDEHCVCAGFV